MRANLLWAAVLSAVAVPASAQYVTHPQTGFGVVGSMQNGKSVVSQEAVPGASVTCPVAMRAERRGTQWVMQARSGGRSVAGQRIYLEIERGKDTAVEAKVTVHGTRARARFLPALSTENQGAADALKSFTLHANSADKGNIASDLRLEGFTSVQSVNLDSITYADGSVWTARAAQRCSVEPDPLMLVSQR